MARVGKQDQWKNNIVMECGDGQIPSVSNGSIDNDSESYVDVGRMQIAPAVLSSLKCGVQFAQIVANGGENISNGLS